MEPFAGSASSTERSDDRHWPERVAARLRREPANGVGGTVIRPSYLDLNRIVAGELAIGSLLFGVGGLFLAHQSDLMPEKQ